MSYIQELRTLVGHRPLILIGVSVIILDQNRKILLQHRTDDDTWSIPGGFMEIGESTEETARREVHEETGLELGQLELFDVFSGKDFFYECPNGDQVFAVNTVYVTQESCGVLRADGAEGCEVRFFSLDDLPSEMLPQIKMIVERFVELRILSGKY